MLPLDQIIAAIERPAYLQQPVANDVAAAPPPQDLALAAQYEYLQGRAAYLDDRQYEAIGRLDAALQLAPRQPQVLRLLGQVYLELSNSVKARQYLAAALSEQGDDVISLLLLGRHLLQQGSDDLAIVHLARIAELDRQTLPDPAIAPLTDYYLAMALLRHGHDAAGVIVLKRFLTQSVASMRTTRFDRELLVLHYQRGSLWLTVGDAYHRLEKPDEAVAAYRYAEETELTDPGALELRLLYSLLRVGRTNQARQIVIDALRRDAAAEQSLALIDYLVEQRCDANTLADTLKSVYVELQRPAPLALAIARLLPADASREFLAEHLSHRPADSRVLAELVNLAVADPRSASVEQAVLAVARATAALPGAADSYAELLLETFDDPSRVIKAIGRMPRDERNSAAADFIRARALVQAGRPGQAETQYRRALDTSPQFIAARLGLVRLLADRKAFDQADAVLQPIADTEAAVSLHVDLLAASNRAYDAVRVLERWLPRQPERDDWARRKAELELQLGRSLQAIQTLNESIDVQPRNPLLYEALFAIYDGPHAPTDGAKRRADLLQRANSQLPYSRVARYQTARYHLQRGQWAEAQMLLRRLATEYPNDDDVLELFVGVLLAQRKFDEVDPALLRRFEVASDQPAVQQIALAVAAQCLREGRDSQARAWLDRLEPVHLDRPDQWLMLAGQLCSDDQAAKQFDRTAARFIRRYPDRHADLAYQWAMGHEQHGRTDRSHQILAKALKRFPDHPAVNNALGYAWVDQGIHLEKAVVMIQKAVEAEPQSPAILDSLGWAYYKLGRYDEAVQWLDKAIHQPGGDHPVLLDHLADAYYRLGDQAKALELWQVAASKIDPDPARQDPEVRDLPSKLEAKIQAVQTGEVAPVAEVPHGHDGPSEPTSESAH